MINFLLETLQNRYSDIDSWVDFDILNIDSLKEKIINLETNS